MRQTRIRVSKRPTRRPAQGVDLRTPSGRPLPY
ncbi:hypothetical protein HD596_009043 [Nonomuraea jabiensis]|uniref:Uncharacterized protein n=1 Tax=Nonomuraea jabiensis TaxID=882448 RepID=A0A7W9GEK5_9ACTN|nr:hypothetical protein [Nonomuraea jabiensis]